MLVKRWLNLPFLGASNDAERKIATGKEGKPVNGDGNGLDQEPTRESTLADFANKTEEDIVQDYNSPIHMWVSIENGPHSFEVNLLTAFLSRLLQLSSHSLQELLVPWLQCSTFVPLQSAGE